MYARGLCTRDIEAAFRDESGGSVLSRSAVSAVTERLWADYQAFAARDLGMFVNYLPDADRPAFDQMMNAILDARRFNEAVIISYHDNACSLWQKFITSN